MYFFVVFRSSQYSGRVFVSTARLSVTLVKGGMSSGCRFPICLTTSAGRSRTVVNSSCCVSCDSRLLVTPPRSFLELRARAEPFFPEPFLLDKWRVGFMRRANFLGDRRFLDLVGILLLKYLIFFLMYHDRMVLLQIFQASPYRHMVQPSG